MQPAHRHNSRRPLFLGNFDAACVEADKAAFFSQLLSDFLDELS